MKETKLIFSPADILLPAFSKDAGAMKRWAVIACDQFTSELSYWDACRSLIGDAPSAYRYIMPEAYLGTPREAEHGETIAASMAQFSPDGMTTVTGLISLHRTLPDGQIRRGLIGKMDLEAYSYEVGSHSAIRATEKTVLERIPPRCRVRAEAAVELPHILILANDTSFFDYAETLCDPASKLYDFDLMLGGGHVCAHALTGSAHDDMMKKIAAYEQTNPGLTYAMGDGNHSLAAAKAHWENLKKAGAPMDHPARYALCELTPLGDESLVFEPIYRIMKNVDPADLLTALASVTGESGDQTITVVHRGEAKTVAFTDPTHALTVGSLQNFLDDYLAAHPTASCDYIHGKDSVLKLCEAPDTVGFLLDGMDKAELFPYVEQYGTLPRKTFSMGEAESKRYYLEMRQIRA